MKHPGILGLAFGMLMAIGMGGCERRPRLAETVRVAKACLEMVHSSLTNDAHIALDDPRLPEVIRSLHPRNIAITGQTVIVTFPLHNGFTEYRFIPIINGTNTWQLFGAGPRFDGERRQLLRFRGG